MEHQNVAKMLQRRIDESLSFVASRTEDIKYARKHVENLEQQNYESQKSIAELKSALARLQDTND